MIYENFVSFQVFFGVFCFLCLLLLALFSRSITSIFDPLIYFCIWSASVLAAGLCIFAGNHDAVFFYNFVCSMILLVCLILLLFTMQEKNSLPEQLNKHLHVNLISELDWILLWILFIINITTFAFMIKEILGAGLESLFLAKIFLHEEYRNPFVKIVTIVLQPMLLAQALRIFYLSTKRSSKLIVLYIIIFFSMVSFILGGRSIIMGIALMIGGTIVLYRHIKHPPAWSHKYFTMLLLFAALMSTMIVSTAGLYGLDLYDAFRMVIDRFLLAGDGLFMWVETDLQHQFIASPIDLLNLAFGQFFGTLKQNFGWQLYEEYVGHFVYAPYGPNLIFPFQFYFANWAGPFLLVAIAAIVSYMRYVKPANNITDCCRILIVSNAFLLLQDLEYAAFFFGFVVVFWMMLAAAWMLFELVWQKWIAS